MKNKKEQEYITKIATHLSEIFTDDCDNRIDPQDFDHDDNATIFFHALNTCCGILYQHLTGDSEIDLLGYNHISNRLIHQFNGK